MSTRSSTTGLSRSVPYSRVERLRVRKEFNLVQSKGSKAVVRHLVVVAVENGDSPRFGLVVTRKVGNAVVRNRFKRQMREIIRRHYLDLPAMSIVVIARKSVVGAELSALDASFRSAVSRLSVTTV